MNFQMFKLHLEKAEETGIKLPKSIGSSKKQESPGGGHGNPLQEHSFTVSCDLEPETWAPWGPRGKQKTGLVTEFLPKTGTLSPHVLLWSKCLTQPVCLRTITAVGPILGRFSTLESKLVKVIVQHTFHS